MCWIDARYPCSYHQKSDQSKHRHVEVARTTWPDIGRRRRFGSTETIEAPKHIDQCDRTERHTWMFRVQHRDCYAPYCRSDWWKTIAWKAHRSLVYGSDELCYPSDSNRRREVYAVCWRNWWWWFYAVESKWIAERLRWISEPIQNTSESTGEHP